MKTDKISKAVIRRLPRYYRQLEVLFDNGAKRISSSELALQMGLNPSQVRQDLNCFGGFGQQGYGYSVKKLLDEIGSILGLKKDYSLIIAGAGNIGHALANYEGFPKKGFNTLALFDIDPNLIGKSINNLPVLPIDQMSSFIKENNVSIGVIAARRTAAQALADQMVEAGVKGIWNFVPADIVASVPIENVRLIDSMYVLSYHLQNT